MHACHSLWHLDLTSCGIYPKAIPKSISKSYTSCLVEKQKSYFFLALLAAALFFGALPSVFLAGALRFPMAALPFLVVVVSGAGLAMGWLFSMNEQSGRGPCSCERLLWGGTYTWNCVSLSKFITNGLAHKTRLTSDII